MKKLYTKLQLFTVVLLAGVLFFSTTLPVNAYIQKEGTVTEAVTLRQNADEASKQVMELASGQAVKVNNEITDNSGVKWYQIFVNGNTMGYVPADTVSVEGGSGSNSSGNADTTPAGPSTQTQTQTQTQTVTVTERVGTVTAQSAIRVREKASTSSEQIASMEADDTFLVLADENAADGHVWYKVEFDDHGKIVYGYVRSDLVSVKEVTREEQIEVEVPVVDTPDVSTEPTTEMEEVFSDEANVQKTGGGIYKVLMILFLLLLIVAIGAAVFFYMRWQDAEAFIDELYEKQQKAKKPQPQAQPVQRTAPVAKPASTPVSAGIPGMKPMPKPVMTAPRPVGQPTVKPVSQPVQQPVQQPVYEPVTPNTADIVSATQRELQNSQSGVKTNQSSGWKSKNFLTDDYDELEFDFLDMDEK